MFEILVENNKTKKIKGTQINHLREDQILMTLEIGKGRARVQAQDAKNPLSD
jgi:hypothetical protein